ncbi:hypothetical protein [Acidihalobacter aeolianus]|uniref:hypothetical protein n=1 Tax=Acidihalobacter aeolianus TaxID=2792603 RepID=UPI0012EA9F53|nr:hypothetical protein [Acidihalobacter aeolianus]
MTLRTELPLFLRRKNPVEDNKPAPDKTEHMYLATQMQHTTLRSVADQLYDAPPLTPEASAALAKQLEELLLSLTLVVDFDRGQYEETDPVHFGRYLPEIARSLRQEADARGGSVWRVGNTAANKAVRAGQRPTAARATASVVPSNAVADTGRPNR